jgi:hypothetical protein
VAERRRKSVSGCLWLLVQHQVERWTVTSRVRRYNVGMAETWGDAVERLRAVAAERGKQITDEQAKEVITREYRDLFPEGFDPDGPAPEISAEEYENMADLADLDH